MPSIFDLIGSPMQGGGLLDWLKGNMQQPMPSGLPSDTAQYGAAVPQNPPPVITAQQPMPQVGNVPQVPQQPMAQPAAPRPFGIGNLLGNLSQGLITAGRGGDFAAGFAGQPNDPRSIVQQQAALEQQQKQQAIRSRFDYAQNTLKLSPQEATLFAVDPASWKSANDTNKEKYSVVKTGQDAMGRETYGTLNQGTGEITPYKAPGASSEDLGSGLPGDMSKTGQDYINSIPDAGQRAAVEGLVHGTYQLPLARSAKSQQMTQTLFAMAKQADPSFDPTTYSARQAGMKSFTSGTDAATQRSLNQVMQHIGGLADSADKLNNGSYPLLNYAENAFNNARGDGRTTDFQTRANAVADEVAKIMKGTGANSDSEIREWKAQISPNMSPTQQKAAIGALMEILKGGSDSLEQKRLNAIGPIAAAKAGPLLSPEAQAAHDKITAWANGTPSGTTLPSADAINAELAKRGAK